MNEEIIDIPYPLPDQRIDMKCNYCGSPIIIKRKIHGGWIVDITKCQSKQCGYVYYYGVEKSEK